jgi:hypothetical protein
MYKYIGGELRYTFRNGPPEVMSHSMIVTGRGYTHVVTYDLLVYAKSKESKIRPFWAGGAGIKVYTGIQRPNPSHPLADVAVLSQTNQVEPAISVGGGRSWKFSRRAQFLLDFRTLMSPLPNEVFRRTGVSRINGWLFDFVPLVEISYVF